MEAMIPEKAALLKRLEKGGFNVPEFIYVSAVDFKNENFKALETFLDRHRESFKVIAAVPTLKRNISKVGHLIHWRHTPTWAGLSMPEKRSLTWPKRPNSSQSGDSKNSAKPLILIWRIWG